MNTRGVIDYNEFEGMCKEYKKESTERELE
jgi:hypothetical protein